MGRLLLLHHQWSLGEIGECMHDTRNLGCGGKTHPTSPNPQLPWFCQKPPTDSGNVTRPVGSQTQSSNLTQGWHYCIRSLHTATEVLLTCSSYLISGRPLATCGGVRYRWLGIVIDESSRSSRVHRSRNTIMTINKTLITH